MWHTQEVGGKGSGFGFLTPIDKIKQILFFDDSDPLAIKIYTLVIEI